MNSDREFKVLGCGLFIFWLLTILASLGVTIGIIIVAIHFIAKYW